MSAITSHTTGMAGHYIAIMLTRRCNMTCGHCSVESSPRVKGEPSDDDLLAWTRQAAAAGVRSIRYTGGEPMLRQSTLVKLLRECRRLGVSTSISTNGFWGRTPAQARAKIRALRRAGLDRMTVSYDRYHADFQGPEPVLNIAREAEALGWPININLIRGTDEHELADVVSRLADSARTRTRTYELQAVGRARDLPDERHRRETEGFCTASCFPAITDDGRVIACNGPAYFEGRDSPLMIGSLGEQSFAVLLERHRQDPILETIRTSGPSGLRAELLRTPGFEQFPFRERYLGMCDLCHHITRDAAAVAALRARLQKPELVAARLAAGRVIQGNRQRGLLSGRHVNGLGAARLFFRAATEPRAGFAEDEGRILGHAHLDWRRQTAYLAGSGLARPLLRAMDDPSLMRWAPDFFRDAIRARGVSDGLRELVQREAIRQLDDVLTGMGVRGVLLKGAAFLARTAPGGTARSTGDIDIFVEPAAAAEFRSRLIARGFEGSPRARASTFHHLEPIYFQKLPVEIHTRIMAGHWGLPESDMIATAEALPERSALSTCSPEGLLLHAAMHASASFFSFGLKTAWDVAAVLERVPCPDWDRLANWAERCRAPLGFWAPLRVLADGLSLSVPSGFLCHAPHNQNTRRAETVAAHRLFTATEGLFDLDAVTKLGLAMVVQDGWAARVSYLVSKVRWRTTRPSTWQAARKRARRADVLRQAWRQYTRYRRAVQAGAFAHDSE